MSTIPARVPSPTSAARPGPTTLLGLVAASGLSALVYEVAWMRMLAGILGSTSSAVAAVLAAFMGGLAIGSIAFGRRADRHARPLALFAWLEVGIGVTAVLLPFAFDAMVPVYRVVYAMSSERGAVLAVVQFAMSVVFLLVPTALMGGTLPALVRAAVPGTDAAAIGRGIGRLYAANTLGAMAGALAAGFWLIPAIGLRSTVAAGAALNLANAAIAYGMRAAGAHAAPAVGARRATEHDAARGAEGEPASRLRHLVLAAAVASGFVALASEVAWTRILVFELGSTTYAFAAMLTTYLGGLAVGSAFGTRVAGRTARPERALAIVQGLVAVVTVASLAAYVAYSPALEARIAAVGDGSWARATWLALGAAALVLVPLAALMGAAFPLACAAYAGGRAHLASAVGRLYAGNTLGAVAGSLAATFAIIPVLGLQRAVLLLASVSAWSAAALVAAGGGTARRSRAAWACAAAVAVLPCLPVLAPFHRVGPAEQLVFYREGPSSTVSVVEDVAGTRKLYIDKIAVAGTDPVLLTDQKSLAHVPMLLRPHATTALTVGFGSGGASWSFTRYGRLARVDAVEIDPTVLEAAPYLLASNHGVLSQPRLRLLIEDAHSYLRATATTYDIISTDCTDLRYKSNALLYTREYFALCRRRLNPGGLVAVWLPIGGLSTDDLRTALATFTSVFPRASIWYLNNVPAHYALLVGTDDDVVFDAADVARQIGEPAVGGDLAEVGLADAWKLYSAFVADGDGAAVLASGAAVNTEDRPILEFSVPRTPFRGSTAANLLALLTVRRPPRLASASASQTAVAERYWASASTLLRGHATFLAGTHDYAGAVAQYRVAARLNPANTHIPALVAEVEATGRLRLGELQQIVSARPGDARARNDLGLARLFAGDARAAAGEFTQATTLGPADWEAWFNLGLARERLGEVDAAEAAYRAAMARGPNEAAAQTNLGLLLLDRGRAGDALEALRAVEARRPREANAAYHVGLALQRLGEAAGAEAAYRRALARAPDHAGALTNLGTMHMVAGRGREALDAFDRAVRIDPTYADAHYDRGLLLDGAGRLDEARAAYEQAVAWRPEYPEAHNNLGILAARAGDPARATAEYRRAIAARPGYAEAHANLALALLALRQPADARVAAERSVALDPRLPQAQVSLGLAAAAVGDHAAAVRAFEQARALDPTLPAVPVLLAQARRGR